MYMMISLLMCSGSGTGGSGGGGSGGGDDGGNKHNGKNVRSQRQQRDGHTWRRRGQTEVRFGDPDGKVHGQLWKTNAQLSTHTSDELKTYVAALEQSVRLRIAETIKHKKEGTSTISHGERQAEDQQAIKRIQKILKDRGDL